LSRGVLIAIVAGIIIAAVAAGIVAATSGDKQQDVPENGDASQGRKLTLDLNENLSLQENP
jgi:Flp pilus assembly protein CpaB